MLASSSSICTMASSAQMIAAIAAHLRSRRPAGETMPFLPDGSRKLAASSQPIVTMAAIVVSARRIGVPHATSGPGSGSPGRAGW